ncbi:MAG: carboxypeptidase regulatory-like domain-containing protein [Bryobacteraceae bacterium]
MAFRRILPAAGLLWSVAACTLLGQNPTATLVGSVLDASGAAVAGATLEVRNTASNELRTIASDDKGEFTIPNLPAGDYEITVSKVGFRTVRQTNIALEMEQMARMEFRLEPGGVSQTVVVSASAAPLVNTENGAKGEVMVSAQIVEMPLNGRDFADLAYLVPGVTRNAQGGLGSAFAINGARADNTNFIIDGFNDQNPRGGNAQARPNMDALQEFKMQTSNFSAEYGRLAGGVMNMVLKTGGNQFHGVLFEFVRNDLFDTRNFFDAGKSELRQNQFGGTLNGPIVIPKLYNGRDRSFFLFSWESFRQVQGSDRIGIVPTEAQRAGDFSQSGPVTDPLSTGACAGSTGVKGACFPDCRIPLSRLNAGAVKAMTYFPLPNLFGQPNNYLAYVTAPNYWDSVLMKFDERLSARDTFSFRYLKRYNRSLSVFGGSPLGTFGADILNHQTLAGLSYTRMFTPSAINEARLGFTRTNELDAGVHQGHDYNADFGIPGTTTDPKLIGFPRFTILNLFPLGDGSNEPVQFTVNNYDPADTFTWVKGPHLIKFGGDVLRTQFFQPYYNNNRGTFNYLGRVSGQPVADFLLGYPESTSRQVGTTPDYLFSTNYGAFAQDDWKIASKLTLNLGLRYDLLKPPVEKYGRYTNFVPELGQLVLASGSTLAGTGIGFSKPGLVSSASQLGLPDALTYTRYNNFAPRFGFAWRPFAGNRTVLRGGYGIFYGGALQNPIRNSLANVFPFAISQTINRNTTNVSYLTMANPFPVAPNLLGSVTNVNGYELHAKTPSLQSWNVTIERDIGFSSAIEISYVGSKGTHLGRQYNINEPFREAQYAPTFPVPYPGFGTINYYGFNANSSYNAGMISLRRRLNGGFFYTANYTYSKSIDDASQIQGTSAGGYAGAQNSRDLHGDRGRSDWDRGHIFSMTFSWVSRWQRNAFVRGWQLAGTGEADTGPPFTPQVSNVNLALGEANRPNRTGKGALPHPKPTQWYDVAAFPPVPAGSFAFGNSGRNIVDGPGLIQINASLLKNFTLGENRNLQLRWEVFNVLNHPNFNLPNGNVNAPNAATVTDAQPGRLMQFGVRYWF